MRSLKKIIIAFFVLLITSLPLLAVDDFGGEGSISTARQLWKKSGTKYITTDTGATDICQSDGTTCTTIGTGGGSSAVTSVFSRTGAVVATDGDYSQSLITGLKTTDTPTFAGVTATTFTGALAGNASTSTALASNPTDCGANTWATTIDASGNLTCSDITYAGINATTSDNWATLVSDETGTGAWVFANSPTLVTPTLGVATATSINGVALTTSGTGTGYLADDGTYKAVESGDMSTSVYDTASVAEQLVGLTATQTLTNKTLTSPTLTTPSLGVAMATTINGSILSYSDYSVSVGNNVNNNTYGTAVGHTVSSYNYGVSVGANADSHNYGTAVGASAWGWDRGVAVGGGADGRTYGVSAGEYSEGSNYGIGVGSRANGSYYSVAVGQYAGYDNDNASTTEGTGNVFLGHKAGYSPSSSLAQTNTLVIANDDMDSRTPLIYGKFNTGKVGIGDVSPDAALDVNGAIGGTLLSADPTDPSVNKWHIWGGDGTGTGDDGDLFLESNPSSSQTIQIYDSTNNAIGGSGSIILGDHYSNDGTQGITDSSSYWLCTSSGCSAQCQVEIKNGLIVGCN